MQFYPARNSKFGPQPQLRCGHDIKILDVSATESQPQMHLHQVHLITFCHDTKLRSITVTTATATAPI